MGLTDEEKEHFHNEIQGWVKNSINEHINKYAEMELSQKQIARITTLVNEMITNRFNQRDREDSLNRKALGLDR